MTPEVKLVGNLDEMKAAKLNTINPRDNPSAEGISVTRNPLHGKEVAAAAIKQITGAGQTIQGLKEMPNFRDGGDMILCDFSLHFLCSVSPW
jgi:hypothetical protein